MWHFVKFCGSPHQITVTSAVDSHLEENQLCLESPFPAPFSFPGIQNLQKLIYLGFLGARERFSRCHMVSPTRHTLSDWR